MEPIWRRDQRSLYRFTEGYYIIDDTTTNAATRYIGVMQDGTVVDVSGPPVDGGDIEVAIQVLRSARLSDLATLVITWPRRPRS